MMGEGNWQRGSLTRGAVAAGNADAVAAAGEMLERGGNAVDAALAAGFAMGVVEPLDCGLGAGGFLIVHTEDGRVDALDFLGTAPAAARYDLYSTINPGGAYEIRVRGRRNEIGHGAVAVPGTARGFAEAHARHGRLPWAELIAPAARLAREGYRVSRKSGLRMGRNQAALGHTDACRRLLLHPEGRSFAEGERHANPDLAAMLDMLAAEGPRAFYEGEIARLILADMAAHDGFLSAADLNQYRAIWRKPARSRFGAYSVATVPPPSSGALMFAGLNRLRGEAPGAEGEEAALARAMLAIFERRMASWGDPAFLAAPGGESTETTSLAAVDAAGNGCCITYSNNNHAGVVAPGTGILLNNQMLLFHPWQGSPNSVEPGKRPVSSMMPSLVTGGRGLALALGASGSTRILTALLQVAYRHLARGQDLAASVAAPRLHAEVETLLADAELDAVAVPLAARFGLRHVSSPGRDISMGSVQAIALHDDGSATAVGDPRSGGLGRVF